MAHDHEAGKKLALKTILVLAAITVTEVLIALTAKGYVINGFHMAEALLAVIMIVMSAYKAYLIVFEFMHMRHEVKGLRLSVLLPMLLLVWAVIAFFYEGNDWMERRDQIIKKGVGQLNLSRTLSQCESGVLLGGQGLSKRLSLQNIIPGHLHTSIGRSGGTHCQDQTLLLEILHQVAPTLAFLTEQILFGNLTVLK